MDDAVTGRDRLGHRGVDSLSMRVVVGVEQLASLAQRQVTRRFRMQLAAADRAVQVGEQPSRLVVVERRMEALRHLAREQQRARVPAAMRRQQVLVTGEERPVAFRHDVAGVLAGDDEAIGADVHRRDSGRTRLAFAPEAAGSLRGGRPRSERRS